MQFDLFDGFLGYAFVEHAYKAAIKSVYVISSFPSKTMG